MIDFKNTYMARMQYINRLGVLRFALTNVNLI